MTDTTRVPGDPRLYVQITGDLRQKITSGDLQAGAAVPIGDVSRQWGACRQTVSKALRALEDDGLIKRYPGHGYIVQAPGQEQPMPHPTEKRRPTRDQPATQRP